MLSVGVRFDEKDATVRYLPGKVTLDQIIARYDDTPFGVSASGPVVTIARTQFGTLRGWTERTKTPAANADKDAPLPIQLFVEVGISAVGARSETSPSFADPPAAGLALLEDFQKVGDTVPDRYMAKIYETVALKPGELVVPVSYSLTATAKDDGKEGEKEADDSATTLNVVLRTEKKATAKPDSTPTGVFLIGGSLNLRLGHLCDQKGCVNHFHQSLSKLTGLGAVNPHPSLKDPRASVYLRAGQPIDVWSLREDLRDQSIEIAGITPRDVGDYRLRIELPRWKSGDTKSGGIVQQCMACRERVVEVLEKLDWATQISVAGGGVNFRPKNSDVDLVQLLNAVSGSGAAPSAVWLVPAGVPMPKPAPPLAIHAHSNPGRVGSQAHPIIEFELGHTCEIGTTMASLLHQQKWASESRVDIGDLTQARALISDRKRASLTPLLTGLRSAGKMPQEIRLRDFGDVRVSLEFAHICGDVVYSKPPIPKKKKKDEEKKDEKPKKPFVPQPLSMANSSNGRKAIQAAIQNVPWIKNGTFYDYHTKFEFRGGPRKIHFALQPHPEGEDVVRLDELITALRAAGFPPKAIHVSRRFPGVPFGKPLPGDLELTDRDGNKQTLASFKKPGRPLAIAFVCVNTKSRKYTKYQADPRFFGRLSETIDTYKDRVDVVAISANEHDKFPDVVEFWDKTGLDIPLLHSEGGKARKVFNMQIAPPPHVFVFDADGLHRYGGVEHSNWEKPDEKHEDYLAQAIDLVIAKKFLDNGAVFYNKSVCNCAHPKCSCPKCGCGSTCRCGIKHCGVGF